MSVALPYPSMSFVPLDVLTAAEMNQMVANDQYLAGLFPVTTPNIADGSVTISKTNFDGIITNSSGVAGTDVQLQCTRTDTGKGIYFGVGAGGQNRGIWDVTLNKWVYCLGSANTPLAAPETRILGGWYCAGISTVTNSTSTTVTLPTTNPWGLKVFASVEATTTVSSGWCDLCALNSSNGTIQYDRVFSKLTAGSSSAEVETSAGNPFAVLPLTARASNATCVATCVKSGSGNFRSWNFKSTGGGTLTHWSGGSRETSGGSTAKIQCIMSNAGNIHLEVWAKDNASSN